MSADNVADLKPPAAGPPRPARKRASRAVLERRLNVLQQKAWQSQGIIQLGLLAAWEIVEREAGQDDATAEALRNALKAVDEMLSELAAGLDIEELLE